VRPCRTGDCHRGGDLRRALGEVTVAAELWRRRRGLRPERRIAIPCVDAQRRTVRGRSSSWRRRLLVATGARRVTLFRSRAHPARRTRPTGAQLVHSRARRRSGDDARPHRTLRHVAHARRTARRLAEHLRVHPDDAVGWRELAELREEPLFDPAGAAEAWRALATLEPRSRAALAGLRRSAERIGDAAEVARVLACEIEIGAHEPAGLWRRLARVRLDRLGDIAGAECAFAAARAADPRDLDSLRALARLAERARLERRDRALRRGNRPAR
jgi:hypothetical protein